MGAIKGHSLNQSGGHISLERWSWVDDNPTTYNEKGMILIPADNVEFVEFLPSTKKDQKTRGNKDV